MLVDVAFERKLKRTITLDEIKQHADELGEDFALIRRGNRLSVLPVTAAQWKLPAVARMSSSTRPITDRRP